MKNKYKKSQANVEFIMILSMLLIFFLIFFSVIIKKQDQFNLKTDELIAKSITEEIALVINNAKIVGNGFFMQLYLPDSLDKIIDYNITIYSNAKLIEIKYDNKRYNFPITTSNIDDLILFKGLVNITNIEGKVYVSQ
jgi:hypothetical protein